MGAFTDLSSFTVPHHLDWSPESLRFLKNILDLFIRRSAFSLVNSFHRLSGADQLLRNENQVTLTELGPAVEL
jgi:hypothetical protein